MHSSGERCEPCGDTSFLASGLVLLAVSIAVIIAMWRRTRLVAFYHARKEQLDAIGQRANSFFVTMQILLIYQHTRIQVGGTQVPRSANDQSRRSIQTSERPATTDVTTLIEWAPPPSQKC